MAEEDKSQKTEQPTGKRLEEARKKGQVAQSKEINNWFILFAGAIVILLLSPYLGRVIIADLERYLSMPHLITPTNGYMLIDIMKDLMKQTGYVMLLPFLFFIIAGILGHIAQKGWLVTTEPLKPKLSKISPLKGLKRIFSIQAAAEFIKGLVKLFVIGGIIGLVVYYSVETFERFVGFEPLQILDAIYTLLSRILVVFLFLLAVVAGLDFAFQAYRHTEELKMTKQEVKDERKQSEGDPAIKSKLRQIRMERHRQRISEAVPEATAVIINPTHYSIAIKYVHEEMEVPIVVAKGTDYLALKIREIATEHGVPLVENAPLARALYSGVEVGDEVPPEHYKAVAAVIRYVMGLKGKAA